MQTDAVKLARLGRGAGVVLLCLLLFPPWRPAMPSAGLDPAWFMVIGHALTHGWQFGRDVIFTYGPLGALAPPAFFPGLFLISIAYWLAFYAALGGALLILYRAGHVIWWIPLFAALALVGVSAIQDGRVFAACFVLFLVGRRGGRIGTTAAATLAMLQGIAALMKMTYAAASFPAVILTDVARFARYRAPPVLTPLYLTAYLAAYLAAGQELSGLWTYLAAASEISSGYSEAMVEYAPIGEVAAFMFIAFAATAMIAHREAARNLRQTMDAALAMAVFGLLAFLAAKAGFVRHDIGHAVIAWAALALLTVTYLGDAVSRGAIPHRMGFAVLTLASLVYFSGAHLALIGRSEHGGAAAMAEDTLNVMRDDVAAVARFTFGGHYSQLMREWPEFLKSIRESHPLPPFTGTADIAGGDQAILLAHEADYRPRPVFQTYSVYTPGLIARNRDFLRSERAPQTFLFKIAPINGRFPALEEGALWPDLLRLYDAAPVEHGYTALTRRAVPREVSLEPIHETRVSFGQAVDISQWNDAVLWLELDLEPSWLGRLRNLLFKPPLVEIVTTFDDGRTLTHRLVPGMAHTGFVLSPFVDTTERFVDLKSAASPRVASVAVGPAKLDGTYYRGGIAVRLKRLRIGEP
ncbi:MAG: hypothetical protein AB7I36_03080 [Rhodospirillaceae bacterium]